MQLNFKMAKYRFFCETLSPIEFSSFPGTTLRGAFGYAFRENSCLTGLKDCGSCLAAEHCVYTYVFETPIPKDKPKVSAEKAPHPFVLEANAITDNYYTNSQEWYFDLILIGQALQYLPMFIQIFRQVGYRGIGRLEGKFHINNVMDMGSDLEVSSFCKSISSHNLTMEILTPLRLMSKGKPVLKLNFHELMRHSFRRISNLNYFHGDQEFEVNYAELLEKAKSVEVLEEAYSWTEQNRYSTRQNKQVPLGGLIGSITFSSGWQEFYEWLNVIEKVHLGKNCTFGLGKISFKPVN